MFKRLTAWFLTLALVFSVLPAGIMAEGAGSVPAPHSHSAAQHNCEHCEGTITWTAWDKTDSLPKTTGHYYLTADVTPTAQTKFTGTNDVTICLNGYSISGEKFGATILYVQDSAKLTIADCTAYTDAEGVFHAGSIKNGKGYGATSGAIYAKGSSAIALYDCIITNNQLVKNGNSAAGYGGAVQLRGDVADKPSSLYIENVLFENNNSGQSAGALCVFGSKSVPTVTVKDCTFKNNTALTGGASYLTKATATFDGCTFEGNSAEGGGAVFADGSTLNMKDCLVKDNTSTKDGGGNVRVKTTTAVLESCTIEGNIANGSGGSALYIHGGNSNVTMKDCTVKNNKTTGTTTTSRGGVYVTNKTDKLTVTGKTIVDDNKVAVDGTAVERNVFTQNAGNAIDVGGLSNGANVGIYPNWDATTVDFATAATAPSKWSSAWVLCDRNGMAVDYNETEKFHYVENLIHEHCICGITGCADTSHQKVVFEPWTGDAELPDSGTYYLTEDVNLNGAAELSKDLTLCLNGHTVTQTKADNRVIGITAGKVIITGCKGGTITGGKAASGAGVNITGEGTVVQLHNITITGNASTSVAGGVHVVSKAQATLTNVTVSGNTAKTNGGGIAVRESGKLTMIGGKSSDNESVKDGGGIYVQASTEVTITDTEFSGNDVTGGAGGGVAISGKATLTNITVKNNTAANGGGMIFQGSSDSVMNGGSVIGNEATKSGGGIYASKKVTLNGTSVTGNKAATGDGVYVATTDVLTVTGDTVIKSNDGNNLYLSGATLVCFDKLTSKAFVSVGVKDNAPRAITGKLTQDPTAYVYSDSGDLQPAYRDDVVYLDVAIKHSHCLCSGAGAGCAHGNVNFAKWDKTDSLPTSGNYYLENDVVLTAETSVTGDLNLCLNGHTVTAANNKRHMSTVKNQGVTIAISDCTAAYDASGNYTAGKFTGGRDVGGNAGGGSMYIRAGSTLKIFDGSFIDNRSYLQGGAICMADGTTFEMHDGEFVDNQAVSTDGTTWKKGGALAFYGCDATITGGIIKFNKANNGGAIAGYSKSDITITGGTICDNWSKADGAGLYVNGAGLYVSGTAKVFGNESDASGGNICYGGNSYGSVSDITVEDGSAGGGAGAMVQNGAVVTFTNVTFKNNTSNNVAGAVRVYKATLTMNNCTITGNTAKTGAAINAETDSALIMNNSTITNNTTTDDSGAVRLDASSSLKLTGKNVISGNQGGNLRLLGGALMDVSGVTDGSEILLTANVGAISTPCADLSAYFKGEAADRKVVYRDGALYMATHSDHQHCLCMGDSSACDHTVVEWAAWKSTTSLPTSGNYYLENDVVLTAETSVTGDLNLCLNGHTVQAANNKRHMSTVKNQGVTIVISDCTAAYDASGNYTAGKFTGGRDVGGNAGGGSMYIRAGSTLKIFDGIFTDNRSYLQGGAICMADGTTFEMHGGEFSENKAVSTDGTSWKKGGALAFYGCNATITGGTVKNNMATNGGAIAGYSKSDITITGGTICGNWSKADGAGLYVNGAGLYVSGTAKVFGNTSDAAGGNICYGGNSYGSVSDITVEDGYASGGAGAMVQNGAVVTFTNVTFKNNNGENLAGAVRVYKATLTMNGCTITGNRAKTAAAINADTNSALIINNSTITNNTTTDDSGAVRLDASSSLKLTGQNVISGNQGGNLLLLGGALMDVSGVTAGSEVWVTANLGPISTACDDLSAYFKSESVYCAVVYRDGALHMATDGSHKHCYCMGDASACDHNVVEWAAWESTTSLPTSGHYYLVSDVTLTGETSISGEVSICLNGYTVTAADGKRHISTVKNSGASIVLCDCTARTENGVYTAGKLTGGIDTSGNTGGGSLYIRAGSKLQLFDGIICDNYSSLVGGAISFNGASEFIMYGGQISNNKTYTTALNENGEEVIDWNEGGAIFVTSGNDIKILGGTIQGNEGAGGGGIRFSSTGNLLIAGGTISDNIAHGQGGGVFASKATVNITGGTITGNHATSSAGGLCLGTSSVTTMSGGVISNNTAPTGAGVVIQGSSILNLCGGKISDNDASATGGAIGIFSSGKLVMTGGEITGNTSVKNGAGIYNNKGIVEMSGGAISNNTAGKDGGAIYVNATGCVNISGTALIRDNLVTDGSGGGISYGSTSTGTISGGIIEENKAGGGAGLMIQNTAVVEITDGIIRNNKTASSVGGGVRVYKATLTITGGTFQGNEASGGGGVYAATKSTLNITGGTFQNNKARTSTGGGIAVASETVFTMTGGTVKNNSAKTTGGGISSNKCTTNISGVTVTGNTGERDGAGIYNTAGVMNIRGNVVSAYNTTKGNGGGFCYGSKSSGYVSGISVYGNTVEGGGGAAIIQGNANVTIGYASITGNTAKKTAGGIYVYKATLTMTGGKIANNTANSGGGGIYATNSGTVKLSNVTVSGNTGSTGGGVYLLRTKIIANNVEISENASKGSGSGLYTSGGTWDAELAGGEFTDVKFIGNKGGASCSGGALYANTDVEVTFTNCLIQDNYTENYAGGIYCAAGAVPTVVNCTFIGNESPKNGGGLYTGDSGTITGCLFKDNKADKGAGLFAGNYMERWHCNGFGNKRDFEIGVTITDCVFEGNKALTDGGGFHLDMSAYTTISDCTFTGNSAGVAGSAMWLWENCTMTDLTVTGNVCGDNGHAVVLADSEFDGQTYINGLFKMGGNMIIKDNDGGDLFMDYKTTIGTIMPHGYGRDTEMHVTLDEGYLTQRVDGAYNYEGGDLKYVLTYGDRSITDPEYDPNWNVAADTQQAGEEKAASTSAAKAETQKQNVKLYIAIGAVVAVVLAAAVLTVVLKKKKATKVKD